MARNRKERRGLSITSMAEAVERATRRKKMPQAPQWRTERQQHLCGKEKSCLICSLPSRDLWDGVL